MPTITQGNSVDLNPSADSTLTIQNPGGFAIVENPIGTRVWTGGQALRQIDIKGGTVRVTATTRDLYYELVTDPAVSTAVTTLYNVSPNITLNDTAGGAGTTATPFGVVYTIPGGLMGPNSGIRLWGAMDWVGGNSKSVLVRVGQSSDTWATASSAYTGQSGLSSQIFTTFGAYIWNDGALNAQRGNPANTVNQMNSSTASRTGQTTINTALDWNIWVGVQFGTLNGGDTCTLRRVLIELIP